MILAEKIIMLRKKCGWSQEELAMQLNISRQSVSKWESGQSIPDLEKILKLSELFGVSTDYLLKDSVEAEEADKAYLKAGGKDEADETRSVSVEEASSYMELVEKASSKIALGVSICILSPILLIIMGGMSEYGRISMTEDMAGGIGTAVLLVIVAGAVVLFILHGMKLEKYEYLEKESISLQYGVAGIVEMKKERFEPTFKQCIATGVALCIISAVPIMVAAAFGAEEITIVYCIGILLALVAFGVYLFVWAGMIWGSYQKLLEEGDYTREKKLEEKRNKNLATVYWCTATAIYLGYSFVTMNWETSWIIWPVAGVFYIAVLSIAAMIRRK